MQLPSLPGLIVGVGVKVNATEDFVTVPLGLEIGYEFDQLENLPIRVLTSLYYAPQVLSFDEALSYREYRIGLEAEVIDNVSVGIGYRTMEMETAQMTEVYDYNKTGYIGIKARF